VPSRPCLGHVGACAGPYPRGNAGREGEGRPHGQARGHPGEATRRRKGRSQGATGRMSLPLVALLPVSCCSSGFLRSRMPSPLKAGACLQRVAGKRLCLPFGDSGVGQGARGPTRGVRVPAPLGNTGGVQSHEPCVRARKVRRPGTRRLQVSLVIHRSQAQVAAVRARPPLHSRLSVRTRRTGLSELQFVS
jgi:hypothetical protein